MSRPLGWLCLIPALSLLACTGAGGETCGAGTHAVRGMCLPDESDGGSSGLAYYDVRVATQQLSADGVAKIPVISLGRLADGTPSQEQMVLSLSRPGAGTLTPSNVTLGPVGGFSTFIPCNGATPGCLGPFQILLAPASAPQLPVARSWPITLVAPLDVSSSAPCLGGGNVLYFDGEPNHYIYAGTQTITQGDWSGTASTAMPDTVSVQVIPAQPSQGSGWDLFFSTHQLNQPLTAQVYSDAQRYPFEPSNIPGMDISGDRRGCATETGRFQIETITMSGTTLKAFTASFEQRCEGKAPTLRGCVHFEQ